MSGRTVATSFEPNDASTRFCDSNISVSTRRGETVAQLVARETNEWSPEALAVANGIGVEDRLSPDLPVKIARSERYDGR